MTITCTITAAILGNIAFEKELYRREIKVTGGVTLLLEVLLIFYYYYYFVKIMKYHTAGDFGGRKFAVLIAISQIKPAII